MSFKTIKWKKYIFIRAMNTTDEEKWKGENSRIKGIAENRDERNRIENKWQGKKHRGMWV